MAGLTTDVGPLLAYRPARASGPRRPGAHSPPLVDGYLPAPRNSSRRCPPCTMHETPRRNAAVAAAALARGAGRRACGRTSEAMHARARERRTRACSRCSRDSRLRITCWACSRATTGDCRHGATRVRRGRSRRRRTTSTRGSPRCARQRSDATRPLPSRLCEEGLARTPANVALWRALGSCASRAARRRGAAHGVRARARARSATTATRTTTMASRCRCGARCAEAARARISGRSRSSPDLVAADFNLGVLFQEQSAIRRGDRRVRERAGAPIPRTSPPTRTWARCCSPPAGSTPGSRTSGASRRTARRRCRSPCRRSKPASTTADFAQLERYLDGLRREEFRARRRGRARRLPRGAALPAAVLRRRARDCCFGFAQTYDAVGDARLRRAAAAAGDAQARAAAHRLPVRRSAQSRDGQDDVAGDRSITIASRFELHFYSISHDARRVDASVSAGIADALRGRSPTSPSARRRCASRADDLDLLVDLSTHTQGREARHPRAQAGARADHARRERGHRGTVGGRLQAHRPATPTCRRTRRSRSSACCRWKAASIRSGTSRRRPSIRFVASARHRRRRGRHRRVRQRAQAVAALPRAVARRARAHPAREARVLADQSGAARESICGSLAAAGIAADRLAVPPAGPRRRGEPGALRARRFRARSDAVRRRQRHARSARHGRAGRHARRQAARRAHVVLSILANLGVTDTVAQSGPDYVEIAVRLATDAGFMASVRAAIRARPRSTRR